MNVTNCTVPRTISRLIYLQYKLVDMFHRFEKSWVSMNLSPFLMERFWVASGWYKYFALSHNLGFSQTRMKKIATCKRHSSGSGRSRHSDDQPEKNWRHLFFAFLRFDFVKMASHKQVFWDKIADLSLRNVMLLWGVNMRKQNAWPQIMRLVFCSKAFWNLSLRRISFNPQK